MKVVLAGGSGTLGRRIAADLSARGDQVVVLTRAPRPGSLHRQVAWDGATVGPWANELGVVHATSPNPVRNAELMAVLRRVLRRPPAPPTPAPLVRLGAVLLRSDPALALLGRRCVPSRLLDAGFRFAYPQLAPALEALMVTNRRA